MCRTDRKALTSHIHLRRNPPVNLLRHLQRHPTIVHRQQQRVEIVSRTDRQRSSMNSDRRRLRLLQPIPVTRQPHRIIRSHVHDCCSHRHQRLTLAGHHPPRLRQHRRNRSPHQQIRQTCRIFILPAQMTVMHKKTIVRAVAASYRWQAKFRRIPQHHSQRLLILLRQRRQHALLLNRPLVLHEKPRSLLTQRQAATVRRIQPLTHLTKIQELHFRTMRRDRVIYQLHHLLRTNPAMRMKHQTETATLRHRQINGRLPVVHCDRIVHALQMLR